MHLRDWHFFRHFLEEANPPYTPQEMRALHRGVVAAGRGGRDDQLLPRLGPPVPEGGRGKASPDLGADAGHLGRAGLLPRLRPRRARTATTCPTSTTSSACPTRRTGCTTTRPSASTSCSSTSSPEGVGVVRPRPGCPRSTTSRAGTEIRPFHVDVPDEELEDLRRRIAATRWPSRSSSTIGRRACSWRRSRSSRAIGRATTTGAGRGEAERAAAVHDRDRRRGHPLHPRAGRRTRTRCR